MLRWWWFGFFLARRPVSEEGKAWEFLAFFGDSGDAWQASQMYEGKGYIVCLYGWYEDVDLSLRE